MNNSFIQALYQKRSSYNDPDQATMQENSLEKLSSGIYTEDERFIFELLQNAVDAHSNSDCLNISINVTGGYLIFSHNGEAFSNDDIEGICFVGRKGEKSKNTKKIGYKGIGFKSVFGVSSKVYIRTRDICFRFDKKYWQNYWDQNWSTDLGPKPDNVLEFTMPWQVIPIESEVPIHIDDENFNVSTYIALDSEDEKKLVDGVERLMQSCRFLIFLKENNIRMSFLCNGTVQCMIEKKTLNGEVALYVNGKEDSRWMVYQNSEVPLNLSYEQKKRIEKHRNTPDKLKNATSFDLSFAISIENGIFNKVDNSVLYTYLPTSYCFGEGFPFLVNANFITDEGRQHLDVDAEWNKILISRIPEEYLHWISTLSKTHGNYYEVLPERTYGKGNALLAIYEEAMERALQNIAFIPSSKNGSLLKVSEAIFDQMDVSDAITPELLIAHINRIYHKQFKGSNNIICNVGYRILKSYGVFDFDNRKFKNFFEDSQSITNITPESDAKLIDLLCDYFDSLNSSEKIEFNQSIIETRFVLNQNRILSVPASLCVSALHSVAYSTEIDYINEIVLQNLRAESIEWLKSLGATEPSDISLIETGKLFESGYITEDNAIEIGTYFFNLYMNGKLDSSALEKLGRMPMLTKNRSLKQASQLYLSNDYNPALPAENMISIDVFVSNEYLDTSTSYNWKNFLVAIGLSENIELSFKRRSRDFIREAYSWANDFWDSHNIQPYTSWAGDLWHNRITSYRLYIFSLYEHVTNYDFAKIFWPEAFKITFKRTSVDRGFAQWQDKSDIDDNFFEWTLSNKAVIPTTQHKMEIASNVFVNQLSEYCGNYLPVIDINSEIPMEWLKLLNLKQSLEVEDLLSVLKQISNEYDESVIAANKVLIANIYAKLADDLPHLHSSKINTIKEWAKDNLILSKSYKFVSPDDLNYITLDGFTNKNQVYIGRPKDRDSVLNLLALMGVRIITEENVTPSFEGQRTDTDISIRLFSTLPALAVLSKDSNDQKTYKECKDILQKKIESTIFYQCKSISLAYDNSGDTISKSTFAQDCKFYFTGELRPAKMEPLLHPLCSYLGIRGKERELFVILTEPEFSGIMDYLKDKEYNLSDLEDEILPATIQNGSIVSVGGQVGGEINKLGQIADNEEAKAIVLEKLNEEGFDVSNVGTEWSVINGVTKEGVAYPLVVKSCKNRDHRLFLNPEEWKQLFKPNSMLWLHFGNRVVAPIKSYELFTYQDKITLTFDTINLMMDERINKILEVMRYFNNVHLNVATLNPDQHRAEHLEDYLFDNNNVENSDLSLADID